MNSAERPRLFSHLTRTRFLHIEDSLEHRRIRFFIGSFERGHGATSTAYAFLDVDDARVILNDLAWGKPVEFVDHAGGLDTNNMAIARVLKFQSRTEKIWIEIQNGPGLETSEGVVKPNGKPYAEISIPLTAFEARKMGFACLAYLQAWQTAILLRQFNRALLVGK